MSLREPPPEPRVVTDLDPVNAPVGESYDPGPEGPVVPYLVPDEVPELMNVLLISFDIDVLNASSTHFPASIADFIGNTSPPS